MNSVNMVSPPSGSRSRQRVPPQLPVTREWLEQSGLCIPAILYREAIDRFIEQDRLNPPVPGGVVFIGDSDIRLWKEQGGFDQAFGDLAAVNRGFGGARTWETLIYFAETVLPARPRLVVYCAGDNDIARLKEAGVNSAVVGFGLFMRLIEAHAPFVKKVFYMGIHPSPLDEPLWPLIAEANKQLKAFCDSHAQVEFIDYGDLLLGPDGRPIEKYFLSDRLHFSKEFYQKLSHKIRPLLDAWISI